MRTSKRALSRIGKAALSLLIASLLLIQTAPSFALTSQMRSTDTTGEYVYISISNDATYATSPADSIYMHYVPVLLSDVEAIQLSTYGMEMYSYNPEIYGDEYNPNTAYDPNAGEDAATLLKLFIYVMERYYAAGSWADVTVSGAPGSLYLQNGFWGHDENLTYYVNGVYPLAYEGWGSTLDQILIESGDFFNVQMYSDWSFWSDDNAGYHFFANQAGDITHNFKILPDQPQEIYLVRAWGNLAIGGNTVFTPVSQYTVHYGHVYGEPLGSESTVDNGKLDLSSINAGNSYCIWVDGGVGANTSGIVSSPAYADVEVISASTENSVPVLKEGVTDVETTVSLGSVYVLTGLMSGEIFADADGEALTYYLETSTDGVTWGSMSLLNATDSEYTLPQSDQIGTAYYRISAFDGIDFSVDYWQLTLTTIANTAPYPTNTEVTADVRVGMYYKLNLSGVFTDDENDTLSYMVSVNGTESAATSNNYTYFPETEGIHTLVFTASDHEFTSSTFTVTINAAGFSHTTDPWIEIRLPGGELSEGDLVDVELWLYNVEGVKSSNICFDPDVNLVFCDNTGGIITDLSSDEGFLDAVRMENGYSCTLARMTSIDRWQFKWNSGEGITAGSQGIKVAVFSMKMAEAGAPEFAFKNILGTEVLLYAVTDGAAFSNVLYNSQVATQEIGELISTIVTYGEG